MTSFLEFNLHVGGIEPEQINIGEVRNLTQPRILKASNWHAKKCAPGTGTNTCHHDRLEISSSLATFYFQEKGNQTPKNVRNLHP